MQGRISNGGWTYRRLGIIHLGHAGHCALAGGQECVEDLALRCGVMVNHGVKVQGSRTFKAQGEFCLMIDGDM